MIKIRRFSLSDLEEVIEIEKASFPKREAWSRNYFETLYLKYPQGFVIAENKGKIVGYIIGRSKNWLGQKGVAEIVSVAVEPGWRQKGIGTKLTNFLINHFRKKKIKEIFLHSRTKNRVGIAFYQNLGFKILKTIKNYYQNGDDAYLMRKSLGG